MVGLNSECSRRRIGGGESTIQLGEDFGYLSIPPLTFSTNQRFNCIISRPAKLPPLLVICHQNFNKIEQQKKERLLWSLNFFFLRKRLFCPQVVKI
uniref:Uncharacterized protein n=1 Tax=Salix viminalis TaxID=40686 RepID=A0A6N2KY73_SALVM